MLQTSELIIIASYSILQCTSLAKAINKSDEKKRAYNASYLSVRKDDSGIPMLNRAVATRWNSHARVILQQRELHDVLVNLCTVTPKKLGLNKFLLTPAEWSITDDMDECLDVSS